MSELRTLPQALTDAAARPYCLVAGGAGAAEATGPSNSDEVAGRTPELREASIAWRDRSPWGLKRGDWSLSNCDAELFLTNCTGVDWGLVPPRCIRQGDRDSIRISNMTPRASSGPCRAPCHKPGARRRNQPVRDRS